MHTDAVVEAKEVWHGGVHSYLVGTWFVFTEVGIIVDGLAGDAVFDDTVDGGFVINVFFRDPESACRCDVLGIP